MQTKSAIQLSGSNGGSRSRAFRVSRLTAALAAAGLLALGSAQATLITDATHEPTNDLLSGATPGGVGDEFQGCVGFSCNDGAIHSPTSNFDPADFVSFGSLVSGATYTLTLKEFCSTCTDSVDFDLYNSGSSSIDQFRTLGPGATLQLPGLTGLTELAVGVHISTRVETGNCCEGYSVKLERTSTSVPEPASVALVTAGLLGAFVARRRKRR